MAKNKLGEQIWAIVLPTECAGCGREGEWLCRSCWRAEKTSPADRCGLCARAATDGLCKLCRARTGLVGLVSLLNYQSPPVARLIRVAKYDGQFDGWRFLVRKLATKLLRRLNLEEARLVPVPLAVTRQRERGFNQAEIIAEGLARLNPDWSVARLLKRVINTPSQTALTRRERLKNINRRTFVAKQRLAGQAVIICDDVATTGATLAAAAKTLRRAGAGQIWAVTIAHD